MNKSLTEKISKNLSKLSALFAAQGAIALSIHTLGFEASSVVGETTGLITNLNYLEELKEQLMEEITNDVSELCKGNKE